MDLTATMQLNTREPLQTPAIKQTTATARTLLRHLPDDKRLREGFASRDFTLCEVAIGRLAVVEKRDLLASTERATAPIVVDVNKRRVGRAPTGFVPKVVVIEGTSRLAAARKSGALTVLAWVGASALLELGKHAKVVRQKAEVSPPSKRGGELESAMLYSAGGGMGSTGTGGLGSASLQYGGTMDKMGMKAAVKRPAGLPKNPADDLKSAGTSEGAKKAWDTRGRGRTSQTGHPAIENYNRVRQSESEEHLKTPQGNAERLQRNADRIDPRVDPRGKDYGYKETHPSWGGPGKDPQYGKKIGMKAGIKVPKNPADDLKALGGFGLPPGVKNVKRVPKFGNPMNTPKIPARVSAPGAGGMRAAMPNAIPNPSVGSGAGPRVLDAEAKRVARIVTKYKRDLKAGKVCTLSDDMMGSAPPGMEHTVMGLKKHFPSGSSSPFALAWHIHNQQKGMKACSQTDAVVK